jgi:hypothetical protein
MNYEHPKSTLTLRQGLAEYYGARDDLVTGRGASAQAREFFRCHDVAHVVFGCGTTLSQEAVVKIWSLFGTTAGLGLLRDYRLPESQEIYRTLTWREIAGTMGVALVNVPIVLGRCLRLRRRWPWSEFEAYLSAPLVEVRETFGIRVLEVPPKSRTDRSRG